MNEIKLQDILEEYSIRTADGNDMQILHQMMLEFPGFAEDLEDFAAARAVLRFAPEVELTTEEETRFADLGLQNLRQILRENQQSDPATVLQSLTEAAKFKGMNKKSFAAALGLSVSLVQYLEKRRLAFSSIPQTLIGRISDLLETGEEMVAAYLNQPPDFANQASFKTNERAVEIPPKDFSEAVSEDQTLSLAEKRKLLEL